MTFVEAWFFNMKFLRRTGNSEQKSCSNIGFPINATVVEMKHSRFIIQLWSCKRNVFIHPQPKHESPRFPPEILSRWHFDCPYSSCLWMKRISSNDVWESPPGPWRGIPETFLVSTTYSVLAFYFWTQVTNDNDKIKIKSETFLLLFTITKTTYVYNEHSPV